MTLELGREENIKTYFGQIEIPELENADNTNIFSFHLELSKETVINENSPLDNPTYHTLISYKLKLLNKDKNYEKYKGEEKRLIEDRIKEELRKKPEFKV